MNIMNNINRWFNNKPKAFFVDDEDNRCCIEDLEIVKSMNVDVDKFSNFKQLLYTLRLKKNKKYNVGIIHQNGSKYSPQMLSNFIKEIDPTIRLIIYKDRCDLKKETSILI